MFIGLSNIRKIFKDHEASVEIEAPDFCLTSFEFLKNSLTPYSIHVLYIAKSPAELKKIEPMESMNILVFNEAKKDIKKIWDSFPARVNHLEIYAPYEEQMFFELRTFFDKCVGTGLVAGSILNILFYESGIQAMVDAFTRGFNNPIFVFDAGFHLIACTWDMAKKTPEGRKICENMGFTEREYQLANSDQVHKKMLKSEKPILVHHKSLGFDQLLCAIDTRKNLGHIVIDATSRPFNDMDYELLIMLKEGIYQQMRKEEFINDNTGYPYEYFLKDLLDGKIATPKRYQKRLGYVNTTFSDNMYCLVVETARSSAALNIFLIRSRLEFLFPDTKTLMYNGEIIVLFCLPKNYALTEKDYKNIKDLCSELEIYAGISNNFSDLTEISEYYKQALRAIEIGIADSQEPGLFVYSDYYMHHIANIFLQKESEKTYCHPIMEKLLRSDKKNDTDLAETLYAYLLCERNISAAAEYLYIHRNTMTYRLKKIESMATIDYDDPKLRQYLILSYELHKLSHQ